MRMTTVFIRLATLALLSTSLSSPTAKPFCARPAKMAVVKLLRRAAGLKRAISKYSSAGRDGGERGHEQQVDAGRVVGI
ncbi:hypothetical protein KCP78_20505 [Salmonella enterica subsp. enterica]|nr:hypothetical protein KCP78_20505 [Salmonella enterica subsp. enterica]